MQKLRRNRVGSKAADLWAWEVEDVKKMTGPLAVQEYIQELIRNYHLNEGNDPSCVEKIIECPLAVDLNAWKYEHVRQFVLELNLLVTSLKDVCTPQTCPIMKGSPQSEYLCAAHKTPQTCSAYDYMVHNLDQSTSILLNSKNFPIRTAIADTKSLDTLVRRLYRLFSHSHTYHRTIFDEFERDMHLCERFTIFSLKYGFMDESLLTMSCAELKKYDRN